MSDDASLSLALELRVGKLDLHGGSALPCSVGCVTSLALAGVLVHVGVRLRSLPCVDVSCQVFPVLESVFKA
jgi:hypothetical protein